MKNKITGIIVALFAMLAFNTAKAQCSIKNGLSCSITITFTEYSNGSCTAVCNGPVTSLTIPGGGASPLPCSSGCTSCSSIVITAINGISITPVVVNTVSGPLAPSNNLLGSPCGATSAFFDMLAFHVVQ